jgi:hypothetical protein
MLNPVPPPTLRFLIRISCDSNPFTMPFPFWTAGCIYGAASVTLGAFGAHGLKKRISDPAKLANWGTAAQYQVHILNYQVSGIWYGQY